MLPDAVALAFSRLAPATPTTKAPPAATASLAKAPKFIDFKGRPQRDVRYTPPLRNPAQQPVSVAAGAAPNVVAPVQAPPAPDVTVETTAQVAAGQTPAEQAAAIPSEPVATVTRAPTNVAGPGFESNPGRVVAGPPATPPAAQPVVTPSVSPSGLPSGYQPSIPANAAASSIPVQGPMLPPAGYSETAGTYVDSQGITRRIGEDGSIQTVAGVAPAPAVTAPAPEVLLPPVVQPTATSSAAEQPAPRRADLNAVVGSVAVPEAEKASTVVPVTPDVIASAAPAPTRRATPPKPAATPKAEPTKPAAKPDPKPAAKHPKRHWVQIASGGDVAALRFDYRNAARKNPDLFKGLSGWSAPYGKTRRMVVGPFASAAEAQAWQKKYAATGAQALVWQSAEGTVVEPLPTR